MDEGPGTESANSREMNGDTHQYMPGKDKQDFNLEPANFEKLFMKQVSDLSIDLYEEEEDDVMPL